MNKFLTSILCLGLLGGVGVESMALAAETPTAESAGQYVDSSTITAKVKSALATTPNLRSTNISVKTYKGVVQLSGFVDSEAEAQLAQKATTTVMGVKEVKNSLIVASDNETTAEFMDSAAMTAKVKSALLGVRGLNSTDINVATYKGVIQLSGFVDSKTQAQLAEKTAAQVKGADTIRNDLIVKPAK